LRLPPLFSATPSTLLAYGLWSHKAVTAARAIAAAAATSPRYFRGRQVLVPPGGRVGKLLSMDGYPDGARAVVALMGSSSGMVTVNTQALFDLNQPHVLPVDLEGDSPLLFLEDGIRCSYAKPLSKVNHVSALSPTVRISWPHWFHANDGCPAGGGVPRRACHERLPRKSRPPSRSRSASGQP
jgi:hypothetical protein